MGNLCQKCAMLRYVKHIGRRFKNGFREVRSFVAMMCVALWYLKGRSSTCSQEAFQSQSEHQDVEARNCVDSC